MGSGRSSLSFNIIYENLVVLGFILVLLVGSLQTTLATNRSPPPLPPSTSSEHVKVLVKGKSSSSADSPQVDLNYMSKRRVPNGPDPIHNRRAGNSRRPPGQL